MVFRPYRAIEHESGGYNRPVIRISMRDTAHRGDFVRLIEAAIHHLNHLAHLDEDAETRNRVNAAFRSQAWNVTMSVFETNVGAAKGSYIFVPLQQGKNTFTQNGAHQDVRVKNNALQRSCSFRSVASA